MTAERYGLDPAFERVVAALCAQRPKFFGTIGYALDHDAFKNETVQLIVKAAKAIFKDSGKGPSAPPILLQRLRRWLQEGQVTQEQIDKVIDLLIFAPVPLPGDQDVMTELAPVIIKRAQLNAIRTGMDDLANKRSLDRTKDMLQHAERIGRQDTSLGLRFGPEAFQEVAKLRFADRMPFGVPELDMALGGGARAGTSTVIVGGSGAGKSMQLSHTCAYNIAQGAFCGYITLELAEAQVFSRVAANLTLLPTGAIEEDARVERKARKRINRMYPILGGLLIKEMPAKATTMLDVRQWVREVEEQEGRKLDALFLDYADKLRSHRREDQNDYKAMGTVYEDFRLFMHDTKKKGFTASQAKSGAAKKSSNRRVEAEDVSDSIEKLRTADLVVTLAVDDEMEQVRWFVGKHRGGRAGFEIGPLPHDWAHGRVIMGGIYETVAEALKSKKQKEYERATEAAHDIEVAFG